MLVVLYNMVKTLKLEDKTHARLKGQGNVGDTFDDVINRLIDNATKEHVLMMYRLTNKEPPRELYMANPTYFWTEENYATFLKLASELWNEWIDNISRHIANNDEWYDKVQNHREEIIHFRKLKEKVKE